MQKKTAKHPEYSKKLNILAVKRTNKIRSNIQIKLPTQQPCTIVGNQKKNFQRDYAMNYAK